MKNYTDKALFTAFKRSDIELKESHHVKERIEEVAENYRIKFCDDYDFSYILEMINDERSRDSILLMLMKFQFKTAKEATNFLSKVYNRIRLREFLKEFAENEDFFLSDLNYSEGFVKWIEQENDKH